MSSGKIGGLYQCTPYCFENISVFYHSFLEYSDVRKLKKNKSLKGFCNDRNLNFNLIKYLRFDYRNKICINSRNNS